MGTDYRRGSSRSRLSAIACFLLVARSVTACGESDSEIPEGPWVCSYGDACSCYVDEGGEPSGEACLPGCCTLGTGLVAERSSQTLNPPLHVAPMCFCEGSNIDAPNGCRGYSDRRRVDACPPSEFVEVQYGWHCADLPDLCRCFPVEGPNQGSCALPCCRLSRVARPDTGDLEYCSCGAANDDGSCETAPFYENVPACPPPRPPRLIERPIPGWYCNSGRDKCSCAESDATARAARCLPEASCCASEPEGGTGRCECIVTDDCSIRPPWGQDWVLVESCPP
jgi:hypothetical protein